MNIVNNINLLSELTFKTSRSQGKGGQNVNKISSKVELLFNIKTSRLLTNDQKKLIYNKLPNKINNEGILKISVQSERSQFQNKKIAILKLNNLLKACFSIKKKRIQTNPTKASVSKRLERKKKHAYQKNLRSKAKNFGNSI